jgi:RecT family
MSNIITVEQKKQEYQILKTMAGVAINSGKYAAGDYNEATILNIFYTAKSLGIDPMVALNGGFNIIKGKINMSAHFMAALIRRKGHSLKVVEITDQKCVIIGQRKDNGDSLKYEYTMKEAALVGLSTKPNWQQMPKQMLYCACVRIVFRMLFSDLGIAYDADEMNEEVENEDHLNVEVSPPSNLAHLQEVEVQPSSSGIELLKQKLEGISLEYLEVYLKDIADRSGKSMQQVIESALHPQLFDRFKSGYEKEVAKRSSEPADLVV